MVIIEPEDILGPHEVAEILGVTPSRVGQLSRSGELPIFRRLKQIKLFLRQDVENVIQRRKAKVEWDAEFARWMKSGSTQ